MRPLSRWLCGVLDLVAPRSQHVHGDREGHHEEHHQEAAAGRLRLRESRQLFQALAVCAVRLTLTQQRDEAAHRQLMVPQARTRVHLVGHVYNFSKYKCVYRTELKYNLFLEASALAF